MNADERRNGLIEKANSLIDKIQDAMRLVENAERAKDKFARPDSVLSLELPIEGDDDFKDVFKLGEIFDEKGIEKIKAYILTELELLEESNLKLLEAAGFVEHRQDNVPQTEAADTEPAEAAGICDERKAEPLPFDDAPDTYEDEDLREAVPDPEEDDSDMIIVPERLEKKIGKPIDEKTIEKIGKLAETGMGPSEIARHVGVSQPTASRYSKKYAETVANKETKPGRSVSRR